MNTRELKGRDMASRLQIERKENMWIVPSQTGKGKYTVNIDGKEPHCTCPDFELRGYKCKHIYAVEYTVKSEIDGDTLTTTITKTTSHLQARLARVQYGTNERESPLSIPLA